MSTALGLSESATRQVMSAAGRAPSLFNIQPWRFRSWIFPRDPDFAAKAARVLDLYERIWDGRPLQDDEFVISADEKSQLQALRRRHVDLPPAPRRGGRLPTGALTTWPTPAG